MAILETNRGNRRIGAKGRWGEIGQLPVLLGNEPNARGEAAHAGQQIQRSGAIAGDQVVLGALLGEDGPGVAGALARRRPGVAVGCAVAIAVAVVAVPAGANWRGRLD